MGSFYVVQARYAFAFAMFGGTCTSASVKVPNQTAVIGRVHAWREHRVRLSTGIFASTGHRAVVTLHNHAQTRTSRIACKQLRPICGLHHIAPPQGTCQLQDLFIHLQWPAYSTTFGTAVSHRSSEGDTGHRLRILVKGELGSRAPTMVPWNEQTGPCLGARWPGKLVTVM